MSVIQQPDSFIRAYLYAAKAHVGQKVRDSDIPYIVHVSQVSFEVFSVVDELNDPQLALQCAALHDVIEDTDISFQTIAHEFGIDVANGVQALTKNKELDDELQMPDSLMRIKKLSTDIWTVKLADRIANLNPPPGSWPAEKRKKYQDVSWDIYNELKDGNRTLAERLQTKIHDYSRYIHS